MVSMGNEDAGVIRRHRTVESRAGTRSTPDPRQAQAIAATRRTASSVVQTALAIIRKLIRAAR